MNYVMKAIQWFIRLDSTVFLPIIIFIIGIIFGLKPAKAIISGITVGIGSIGLGLVLDLLSGNCDHTYDGTERYFGRKASKLAV